MYITIVTSLKPDKYNRGGPSGLIWEIEQLLKNLGHDVNECLCNMSFDNAVIAQLSIMGLVDYKISNGYEKADKIIVYPDVIIKSIQQKYHKKCIVIGPDATSMVRYRKYKIYKWVNIIEGIKKLYQYIFYRRFKIFEKRYIPMVIKHVVVGIDDRNWLAKEVLPSFSNKIVFLRHPLLTASLVDLENNVELMSKNNSNKRFIFSGDMSKSYIGDNITVLAESLSILLKKSKCSINIYVIGKKNKWIYNIFEKINNINAEYSSWVDNYQSVCHIDRDIHCIPLKAGAGTKNRVVTAIANGVTVITTSIGMENIINDELHNVYIENNMRKFAERMMFCFKNTMESSIIINERLRFRAKTTKEFTDDIKRILK